VLQRRNGIVRKAAGSAVAEQWMAANLDAVFIVLACDETFSLARLERYLAVVVAAGIEAVLVLTKADRYPEAQALLAQLPAGHACTALDAREALTDPVLARYVGPGMSIALLGTSGVGKSTLVNALSGATQSTQAVREGDSRGRHTTTSRQLILLPSGGAIIDTPGIRELALPGAEALRGTSDASGDSDATQGGSDAFADVLALARACRFSDCSHDREPGCAVRSALASGRSSNAGSTISAS
jgi:ribosome biogenesis GTPase